MPTLISPLVDSMLRLARRLLRRDFDYLRAYRKADLAVDYWSVVGPATKEEFETLGKGKLQQLIDVGLTPTSRVLDVGCGTGQLTEPMVSYLAPEGVYYGTDIAPEAIAFCKAKFPATNYHFVENPMRSLPIRDVAFDFIYLGSVFTHMYPDEIRDLILEMKRLLARGGAIIADAFLTDDPQPYTGHRGMVIINAGRLRDIFLATGVRAETLHEWDWQPGVRRAIFKITSET